MPRRPRVFIEGGLYHVYNRAARGDTILEATGMARRFLDLLRRAVDRDDVLVYAYCVMPNHFHLVVRTGPQPLSRTIGFVQGRFGLEYNQCQGSTGPLWQSRYKAKLIENERYLRQLIAYVHLNPVSAGLVDDPARWRWSGHRELIRRERDPLVHVDAVLEMFGETIRTARSAYVLALKATRGGSWAGERPGRLPWWPHQPDAPVPATQPAAWVDERGVSTGLDRPMLDAVRFLKVACERTGFEIADLASRRRGSGLTRARFLVASVGIERWRQSAMAIAGLLGRHPDVVTRWARRGGELRRENRGFADSVDSLDREIAEAMKDIGETS